MNKKQLNDFLNKYDKKKGPRREVFGDTTQIKALRLLLSGLEHLPYYDNIPPVIVSQILAICLSISHEGKKKSLTTEIFDEIANILYEEITSKTPSEYFDEKKSALFPALTLKSAKVSYDKHDSTSLKARRFNDKSSPIAILSDELWMGIFSFFREKQDVTTTKQVCRRFYDIASDEAMYCLSPD